MQDEDSLAVDANCSQHAQNVEDRQKAPRRRGWRQVEKNGGSTKDHVNVGTGTALTEDELEGDQKWTWERMQRHPSSRPARITQSKHRKPKRNESNHRTNASVMFTLSEAKLVIDRAQYGPTSLITPPYDLQTGEYVPFPVVRSYHLGAMGRHRNDTAQHDHRKSDPTSSDYDFDWGQYHGKHIDKIPRHHICSILASQRLAQVFEEHRGLREAFPLYRPDDPRVHGAPPPAQFHPLPLRPAPMAHTPSHSQW
jgi:hypothetical protein